jgi:hypothetical protein
MSIEQKHLEHMYGLQETEYAMKWHGWGSPVGLSIFFLTLVAIAVIIKIIFFG